MPVSFSNIPKNWRMPLYWIETDPSMAGLPRDRLPSLLIGTMLASGKATADVPIAVGDLADAQYLFGAGSMLDGMCEWFFKGNKASELWVLPIAEAAAGNKATATITVTTPATQAGTSHIYIAGRHVAVPVAANDTAGGISADLVAYINADPSMPVVASNPVSDSPICTLTCKWKGLEGNDIDVRVNYGGSLAGEETPVGLVLTISSPKLLTGSGGPVLTTAISNLGDEEYEYVGTGFTDSTSLTALGTEYGFSDSGRWGWMRQMYGHIFGAYRATYSAIMSYGPNNNNPVLSLLGIEVNSPTPVWCWAASYTAKAARALLNDPARPLQTLTLDGCLPAPKHQRFLLTELNSMAGVGIATQRINGDGVPAIMRETTTYQKNLYSQNDDAYEVVTTLATLAALFRNQRQAITSKYPRHKLADDGTRFGKGQAIVTPKIIKGELVSQYRVDEFKGLVENAAAYKANLIVERDVDNVNRVNVLYPPDLVNQLRIFAVLGQFRLQYNRGDQTIT